MRALSVVLYITVLLCISQVAYSANCGAFGDANDADTACICHSGYSGAACDVLPPGACDATRITPDPQVAKDYPVLSETISFSNDILTASLVAPYVDKRRYTDLEPSTGGNAACSFQTPTGHWASSVTSRVNVDNSNTYCSDVFTLSLPWTSHTDCGFARSAERSDAANSVYVSEFVIKYVDDLGTVSTVPIERESSQPYKIWVSFPTTVTVELLDLSVTSVLEINAGLTQDLYNSATKVLTLQLTTVINWPNMIFGDYNFVLPEGIVLDGAPVPINTGCQNTPGTVCVQKLNFNVKLTNQSVCTYNGFYNVSFTVVTCRDNAGVACGQQTTSSIQFTIATSNVCGEVTVEPKVTGTLVAYPNNGYTAGQEQTMYNIGSNAFFKVTLTADGTVFLTFTDIWFRDSNGQDHYLLSSAGTAVANAGEALIATDNTERTFQIYFTSKVFAIAPWTNSKYTIFAKGDIVFDGNQPTAAPTPAPAPEKRSVLFTWASSQKSVSSNTIIELPAANQQGGAETAGSEAPQTINVGGIAGGVVGALALLALIGTVSIYIVKKRKQPKAPVPDSAADATTGAAQSPISTQV